MASAATTVRITVEVFAIAQYIYFGDVCNFSYIGIDIVHLFWLIRVAVCAYVLQNALNSGGATASNTTTTVGSCKHAFVNVKHICLFMFPCSFGLIVFF